MLWIKQIKGGAGRFMGRTLDLAWQEFDETKLDEKALAYFKREASQYIEIAKENPTVQKAVEVVSVIKKKR